MAGLALSPRRRRRLLWLAVIVLLGSVTALLAIRYPNTGTREPGVISNRPASVGLRRASVPFTGARRDAARHVARVFLAYAVLRKDPARAWGIAAPSLREGMTRADWQTGNIPVVPYPAQALLVAKWRLWYSYADRVGFEVGLFPKPRAIERATTFTLELTAFGRGSRRHWLVSSWAPAPVLTPPPDSEPSSLVAAVPVRASPLDSYWLIVPLGLLVLVLLVPVGIGMREWRRCAVTARRHRA